MRLALPLLVLFAASASAQGLDQQFRQQQSERERVLEICGKQYEGAEFWSPDEENKTRFMITPKGVQSILPEVEQQRNGSYKCKRPVYEIPVVVGVEFTPKLKPVSSHRPLYFRRPFLRDSAPMARAALRSGVITPEEFHAAFHGLDPSTYYMLKLESCSDLISGTCLVEYKRSHEGRVSRKVLATDAEYRLRSAEESRRRTYRNLCKGGYTHYCDYF